MFLADNALTQQYFVQVWLVRSAIKGSHLQNRRKSIYEHLIVVRSYCISVAK